MLRLYRRGLQRKSMNFNNPLYHCKSSSGMEEDRLSLTKRECGAEEFYEELLSVDRTCQAAAVSEPAELLPSFF